MTFKDIAPGVTFWMRNVRYLKTQEVRVSDIPYNAVVFGTGSHAFVSDSANVFMDKSELYCPLTCPDEVDSMSLHLSTL